VPNPDPENMANESDVEEEGTSTSEEEDAGGAGADRRRRRVGKNLLLNSCVCNTRQCCVAVLTHGPHSI